MADTLAAAPPAAPASPAAPEAPPLREAVLAGAFFGLRHAAVAARLAAFLAGPGRLTDWFGDVAAARLLADAEPDRLRAALDRDIAAIDALLGAQLDAVLHHARLRRLEGAWRGLTWLLSGIDPSPRVRIRVLNLGWAELCRDLERAADFDQSQLFRRIYEDEFGTAGGEPFGLLVVDHEVRHRPAPGAPTDDVTALGALSQVAAAAFAPVVLAASPALLGVDRFADLARAQDPAAPIRDVEHLRWRSLASRDDTRFLAIALPRLLARPPWGDDPARADGFRYAEYAPDEDSRVWFGAGFAFAAAAVRAFVRHGWPADVRGVDPDHVGGGLVTDLVTEPFSTEPASVWTRAALDIVLTDRQERSLVEAGLMPLSALPFGEEAMFGAVRSLQIAARFSGPDAADANANARLSSQLNSMLCASRFAHYLKLKGREMVGAFMTAEAVQDGLQRWLNGYVNANLAAGPEARARYPLVRGQVSVHEKPGKPGSFGCEIRLQPHFQLDDVAAEFRLTTDIVAPGAAA